MSSHDVLVLHAVLSHLREGVVVLDPDGHVSLINSSAQRLVSLCDPFPPEQLALARALNGENVEDVEFYVRSPQALDGFWIQASVRPLVGPNAAKSGCILFLRDVTLQKQMEKELLDVSGIEKERIGQDLHDGVCQILTGIKFMCNVLIGKLSARSAPEAADVSEIQHLVSQALLEADSIAKGMIPISLEVDGLVSALEELASHTARLYRVSCRFLCENRILILNPEVALNVYRIAQEALTNAVKHGKAKNIALWLTCTENRFTLIVKDDGGVPAKPPMRHGMGRHIMSSRAHQIGAALQFEHLPGGGTMLTCEFSDHPHDSPVESSVHEKSKAL